MTGMHPPQVPWTRPFSIEGCSRAAHIGNFTNTWSGFGSDKSEAASNITISPEQEQNYNVDIKLLANLPLVSSSAVSPLWPDIVVTSIEDSYTSTTHSPNAESYSAASVIARMESLPPNWDSYGSPPLSKNVIEAGKKILAMISIVEKAEPIVSPTSGGGLQFEWNIGSKSLEIYISRDEPVAYLKDDAGKIEEGSIKTTVKDYLRLCELVQWMRKKQ